MGLTKGGELCTKEDFFGGSLPRVCWRFDFQSQFNVDGQQWDSGWDLQDTYRVFFPAFM